MLYRHCPSHSSEHSIRFQWFISKLLIVRFSEINICYMQMSVALFLSIVCRKAIDVCNKSPRYHVQNSGNCKEKLPENYVNTKKSIKIAFSRRLCVDFNLCPVDVYLFVFAIHSCRWNSDDALKCCWTKKIGIQMLERKENTKSPNDQKLIR